MYRYLTKEKSPKFYLRLTNDTQQNTYLITTRTSIYTYILKA